VVPSNECEPHGRPALAVTRATLGTVYQPAHGKFQVPDQQSLLQELCAVVPATLVSMGSDGFQVSILPMLFEPAGESSNGHGILHGHLARGNPHWRSLESDGNVVATFNGADAYVSPSWYEEKRLTGKVVPTWNYTTAIAHGVVTLHHEPEWLVQHVRNLVERHEARFAEPWSVDDPPEGYIETTARAIVGIELQIRRLDAKRKLTQNRSESDIGGTVAALKQGTSREREVAADMIAIGLPESVRDT
jgi:transcriptional regulator